MQSHLVITTLHGKFIHTVELNLCNSEAIKLAFLMVSSLSSAISASAGIVSTTPDRGLV